MCLALFHRMVIVKFPRALSKTVTEIVLLNLMSLHLRGMHHVNFLLSRH